MVLVVTNHLDCCISDEGKKHFTTFTPDETPQKPTTVAPRGVRKTPKSSAVSSHVTLSESAVETELAAEAQQRADVTRTTRTTAKSMVI
jgi:hypothetical protein